MEAVLKIADMKGEVGEGDLPGNEKKEEEIEELSVCAICDNGGELLSCEGSCLRSFHPTIETGSIGDSKCRSLGLSKEQVEEMPLFYCDNCLYKQHQCFACGELGSSDKSAGAEVFPCASGGCGHFYHAHCVAKRLYCQNETEMKELERNINSGEAFICPSHMCVRCRGKEVHEDPELQFAICQRCPSSYHRKCLPRTIKIGRSRCWEGLLPNHRVLLYCLQHEIDSKLKAPRRNHIKFPNFGDKNREASQLKKSRGKPAAKEKCLAAKDAAGERLVETPKVDKNVSSTLKQGKPSKKRPGMLLNPQFSKKRRVPDTLQSPLNKNPSEKVNKPVISKNDNSGTNEYEQNKTVENDMGEMNTLPHLDPDAQRRIMGIMRDAASSVTFKGFMESHSKKVPEIHSYSSMNAEVKAITLEEVESSVEAHHEALKMLEQGFSVEDAKAVCGPELLKQLDVWKNKLEVYLGPFLGSPQSTSYGHRFTNEETSEEEIVEKPLAVCVNNSSNGEHKVDSEIPMMLVDNNHSCQEKELEQVPEKAELRSRCQTSFGGFAPAICQPFSQSSAGWIDD